MTTLEYECVRILRFLVSLSRWTEEEDVSYHGIILDEVDSEFCDSIAICQSFDDILLALFDEFGLEARKTLWNID
jgi:hypothetical protein